MRVLLGSPQNHPCFGKWLEVVYVFLVVVGLGVIHWNSNVTKGLRFPWDDGLRGILWRPDEVEGFGFGGRGVARRSCRGCLLWEAEVDSGEFFFLFSFFRLSVRSCVCEGASSSVWGDWSCSSSELSSSELELDS